MKKRNGSEELPPGEEPGVSPAESLGADPGLSKRRRGRGKAGPLRASAGNMVDDAGPEGGAGVGIKTRVHAESDAAEKGSRASAKKAGSRRGEGSGSDTRPQKPTKSTWASTDPESHERPWERSQDAHDSKPSGDRLSLLGRMILYIREVALELAKVVTPTRRELVIYSLVVLLFVSVVLGIVAFADWAFALLVTLIFGSPMN